MRGLNASRRHWLRALAGAARYTLVFLAVILLLTSLPAVAQSDSVDTTAAVSKVQEIRAVPVPRTDSPRDTLGSFLELRDETEKILTHYLESPTLKEMNLIFDLVATIRTLIDLEAVPSADREFTGNATARALFDVFGRIDLPPLQEVPDEEAFDGQDRAAYRVPETPIRIIRIEVGPRAGEYLFEQRTIISAPRFLRGIEDRPLRSSLGIESWSSFLPQIAGPAIPSKVVAGLPESLRRLWLGTPIWKAVLFFLTAGILLFVLARLHRWASGKKPDNLLMVQVWRLVTPFAILLALHIVLPQVRLQILPAHRFFAIFSQATTLLTYAAWAWIFWVTMRSAVEWIVRAPQIADRGPDANLIRLFGGIIGVVGVVTIVVFAGQALGLPIMSIVAGIGIGGLAVALAIRPTLENLIGGIILFIDRPVRIGDYCTFGANSGTVEEIGIRSTAIRAIDRTLISIPNARFADMELVNWAQCDRMLINAVVGLRFETTPDQMRFLLAKIRKMLHAHPRIDNETIRVRYLGPGASSRDITIRIYALTREWNEFYAIREDVFLRIDDLVQEAGTDYAFPSQTLYLGRDSGTDQTLRDAAEAQVANWRRSKRLPFPRLPKDEIASLQGTLDYPPKGSVEAGDELEPDSVTPERLSAEPSSTTDRNEVANSEEGSKSIRGTGKPS